MSKDNGRPDIAIYSEIINRAALAAKLGYQYGGDRDVYQALGYPDTITYDDYAARYGRQDVARAIINRPVSYTWKGQFGITEAGDDKETQLEKDWAELSKRLKIKSKFVRLDKLSSIGNYGVLLLGFDDVKRSGDWEQPVNTGKRKLLYMKPLGEGHAKIASYVKNVSNPRFGMVEKYDVEMKSPNDPSLQMSNTAQSLKVHHTRVIHIVPELMESEIEGEPVLRSVWNRLMDLEKLVGASAEMFWRGARPGYTVKLGEDFDLDKDTKDDLQDRMDEFEHNLRRWLVTNAEVKALDQQVANPKDHVDIQIQMISAITGIPKRILTGSERGELASEQDITSWYNVIQMRREEHAEQNIVRPFVDKMIEYGVLSKPQTGEYQVEWEDLHAASDKEQAEVGKTRATALKEYATNPMAEDTIPPEAFMKYFLGLDETQIELIGEMRDAVINEEEELNKKENANISTE